MLALGIASEAELARSTRVAYLARVCRLAPTIIYAVCDVCGLGRTVHWKKIGELSMVTTCNSGLRLTYDHIIVRSEQPQSSDHNFSNAAGSASVPVEALIATMRVSAHKHRPSVSRFKLIPLHRQLG
jgi:hypothetical protein